MQPTSETPGVAPAPDHDGHLAPYKSALAGKLLELGRQFPAVTDSELVFVLIGMVAAFVGGRAPNLQPYVRATVVEAMAESMDRLAPHSKPN